MSRLFVKGQQMSALHEEKPEKPAARRFDLGPGSSVAILWCSSFLTTFALSVVTLVLLSWFRHVLEDDMGEGKIGIDEGRGRVFINHLRSGPTKGWVGEFTSL